ncbi:MAG: acyltransferase [Actinomycetes bacterium]
MSVDPAVSVHPAAICESDHIGPGTRIWAFVHILPGAIIGADCNICDHVFVEGGAHIGDRVTVKNASLIWDGVTIESDVFIGPRVTFTNDLRPRVGFPLTGGAFIPTRIRQGATLGANVTIVCGVTVGESAMIGAGAVVTADIPAHVLAVGAPARAIGWVCTCGQSIKPDQTCSCGRTFQLTADQGLSPAE